MHVDHVLPRYVAIDQAQYDALDNLVTLCPNDHARKTVADRKKYGQPTWNRGRKMSPEEIAKQDHSGLAVGRTWEKGKKFSEEHKQRLSEAHLGQRGHWTGKKFTLEHRQKLSAARKGKKPWNAKPVAVA